MLSGSKLDRAGFSDALKKKVLKRDGYMCRYCGDRATAVDHIIPVAFVPIHQETNLVAACSRCNRKIGSSYFPTFEDKRQYIRDNLLVDDKAIPVWLESELRGMGHGLKGKIRSHCLVVETVEQAQHVAHYLIKMKLKIRMGSGIDINLRQIAETVTQEVDLGQRGNEQEKSAAHEPRCRMAEAKRQG